MAHGAGIAGCMTALKDYKAGEQFQGLGVFITLFGFGLIIAIAHFASVYFARNVTVNSLMSDEDPNDHWASTFLSIASTSTLIASAASLVTAIVVLMIRFRTL